MTTTLSPANPYDATLVPVSADAVTELLKAKASTLNFFTRTIRNALRAAVRQDRVLYVGRTATGAYISADARSLPIVDFAALPDGTALRYDGGRSAYSV